MLRAQLPLPLATALLASLLWGPWTPSAEAEPRSSHVQKIVDRGYLWVRCFPQQISPFLAVDTERGPMPTWSGPEHFLGVDVDVLGLVAEELGVSLRIHPGETPSISSSFDALARGDGDVVAGGLTITEERSRRFDFSKPYFRFRDLLMGPKDPNRKRAPLASSRLAVMPGSSYEEKTRSLGITGDRVRAYEFIGEAYEAVAEGDRDYTFADSTMMHPDQLLEVTPVYRLGDERGYGYVLPSGSDLKAVVDRVLTRLEASGELERILRRHEAYGTVDVSKIPQVPWSDLATRSDAPESRP